MRDTKDLREELCHVSLDLGNTPLSLRQFWEAGVPADLGGKSMEEFQRDMPRRSMGRITFPSGSASPSMAGDSLVEERDRSEIG